MKKIRVYLTNWTWSGFEDFHHDMEAESVEDAFKKLEKSNDMCLRDAQGKIIRYGLEIQGADEL